MYTMAKEPHLKGGHQLEQHLQCLQGRRDHIVVLSVCQTAEEEGVDIAGEGGAELITMVTQNWQNVAQCLKYTNQTSSSICSCTCC